MPKRPGRPDLRDDIEFLRIVGYPALLGFVFCSLAFGLVTGIVGGAVMAGIGYGIRRIIVRGSADAFAGFVLPNDRGGAGTEYSHIQAIEAKGDIPRALAEYEAVIAASPNAIGAHVAAADLYARRGGKPERAVELFRAVQRHPAAPLDTRRYVSQRIVDLYLGVLKDEGRALVELRKIADQWPNTPDGDGARRAIANIKNV